MKKITLLFIFISTIIYSQDIKDIDKLTINICNSIKKSSEEVDSVKVQKAFFENIPPFAQKFKIENFSDELISKIMMRLQKNCDAYQKIENSHLLNTEKTDWKILDKKPDSKVSAKDCEAFLKKHQQYYYFEANSEKTLVEIKNGFWMDKFLDNSTSKLYFKSNKCKFELEFIESNNKLRKDFSVKGDKYYYEIIEINKNVLTVIVKSNGSDSFYQFKLYAID